MEMRLKQIQMLLRLTLSSNSFYFLLTQHDKKEQKKSHTKRRFKKKREHQQSQRTARTNIRPILQLPIRVSSGTTDGSTTCIRSCICTNQKQTVNNWCILFTLYRKINHLVDNTQGLTWYCCKLPVLLTSATSHSSFVLKHFLCN